jgi:hypothetical protein
MHFPSESHLMFALVIIVAAVLKAHVNQRAVTTAAFPPHRCPKMGPGSPKTPK